MPLPFHSTITLSLLIHSYSLLLCNPFLTCPTTTTGGQLEHHHHPWAPPWPGANLSTTTNPSTPPLANFTITRATTTDDQPPLWQCPAKNRQHRQHHQDVMWLVFNFFFPPPTHIHIFKVHFLHRGNEDLFHFLGGGNKIFLVSSTEETKKHFVTMVTKWISVSSTEETKICFVSSMEKTKQNFVSSMEETKICFFISVCVSTLNWYAPPPKYSILNCYDSPP